MARATRIVLDLTLENAKSLKPALGVAWQYLKREAVPPMTLNFFNGPRGKKLEDSVSKVADNFINKLQRRIQEIDDYAARKIKRQVEERKIEQEIIKAEAEARKLNAAVEAKAKAAAEAKNKSNKETKKTEKSNDVEETKKKGSKPIQKKI